MKGRKGTMRRQSAKAFRSCLASRRESGSSLDSRLQPSRRAVDTSMPKRRKPCQ